ncbi:C40 family peptidase [Kushneria phosphatilytica]|nr:C40 family peptidase [Kushneria phosphatilytica]OHV12096.1 hypothetical protein BH688_05415 [Kushneria phosphatilytica]
MRCVTILLCLIATLSWCLPVEARDTHSFRHPPSSGSPHSLYHLVAARERVSLSFLQRYQQIRHRAIQTLMAQVGVPYQWGGESPSTGFDCSGLVYFAYQQLLAIDLPRTANGMYHFSAAEHVTRHKLQRGDLVFFRIHSGPAVADHVGVYLGKGRFIQAPRTGERIHVSSLNNSYWRQHYLGARRVLSLRNIAFDRVSRETRPAQASVALPTSIADQG